MSAKSPLIEWTVGEGNGIEVWDNRTQIFRHPYTQMAPQGSGNSDGFGEGDEVYDKALKDFLTAVELTLEHGTPSFSHSASAGYTLTTCGGYRHYLKRDLVEGDVLALRPLTEPMLRTYYWDYLDGEWMPLDSPRYEWLCETSLMVIPAKEN